MVKSTKCRIEEGITNLANMGVIPTDEAQLNLDVIYNSVLNEICSIVPMDSPRQVISCLKLIYGSENKSLVSPNQDAFKLQLMNGVGAVPFNDNGYPSEEVNCSIVVDASKKFVAPYINILPGTINCESEGITDDSQGNLIKANANVGTVDYINGIFVFTVDIPEGTNLTYKFDLYNLETKRNFAQFVKKSLEVFADIYQLDLDSAYVLKDFKGLNIKDNINNLVPQVLTQQIDQYIINKYFKQAHVNTIADWDSTNKGNYQTFNYEDFGSFISEQVGKFAQDLGVVPNIVIVTPEAYGKLSVNKKFIPVDMTEDYNANSGMPKLVGFYNNLKVILATSPYNIDDVDAILTYKGISDAQAAGVFAPYIPVTINSVVGMESNGMVSTDTAYSMAGFAMINPDLVRGIKIKTA